MKNAPTKFDIHQELTDQIVSAIEAGAGDFAMPWHRDAARQIPKNIASENKYRGINVVALWVAQMTRGFDSNIWGTYRQWQEKKAQVRRGEKASLVVFYKNIRDEETTDPGEIEEKRLLIAKASYVFNANQVEGYAARKAPSLEGNSIGLDSVEQFVNSTGAQIRHGGDRAFYRCDTDTIHVPTRDRFIGTTTSSPTESYYSTMLHELTHWTGPEQRLDRQLRQRFGSEAYAMEELVAELGAAFLCADLGISLEPRLDHSAYLRSWMAVLKSDKKAIFTAASKASEAVAFLFNLQSVKPQTA